MVRPGFRRLAEHPLTYTVWLAFLLVGCLATYRIDPYVYGFTVLGLAPVSSGVVVCGLVVWLRARWSGRPGRPHVIGGLSLSIAAVTLIALAILRTFRWA